MAQENENHEPQIIAVARLEPSEIKNFKNFDCGNAFLNKFASQRLIKYDKRDLHKGFVIIIDGELAGYFTTRVNSLTRERLTQASSGASQSALPITIPTISLEQIATDLRFRGRGLGKKLLRRALEITVEVAHGTGVKGLHLWSHPDALPFYRSLGFQELTTEPHSGTPLTLMFMPIETIRQAMIAAQQNNV